MESPEAEEFRSHDHSSHCLVSVEEHEVRRMLRVVNPRKGPGPDWVAGRVLKDCANHLAGVFTNIFNQSLAQSIIPDCLKLSAIISVPKKPNINSLNDFCPVSLTSLWFSHYVLLDQGLFIKRITESKGRLPYVLSTQSQHWLPSGMCVQPHTLHSLYP